MRSSKSWHKLWVIVPAAIILPPLGIYMLWRSPRPIRAKIAMSVVLVFVLGGAGVGGIHTDMYGLVGEEDVPILGYDVEMDSRNRYRSPTIFPLERKIFGEVVNELRDRPVTYRREDGVSGPPDMAFPERRAFEEVGARHNMYQEDVAAIYRKVSSQITAQKKK